MCPTRGELVDKNSSREGLRIITVLKPYSTYKDSGVEWLGQVPEHWEVTRLKRHLVRNDSGVWSDNSDPDGTIVLRSTEQTIDGGWRISNPATIRLSDAQRAAALLEVGDLVVTKSSGSAVHIGKTSLVTREVASLNCCFSNFMQRLRPDRLTLSDFLWRVLNSPVGREQLVFQSTTTTGLGNLNGTIIGNCFVAFPPLPEQTAIVRFLDWAERRIRRVMRARRRRIKLLEEYKQVLIHQAVTGRIDVRTGQPYPAYKDSGVEWLGQVPEHWEVRRGKVLFVPVDVRSSTGEEELLTVSSERGVVPRRSANVTMFKAESYVGYKLCWPGDLVINSLWAWARGLGVSRYHGIVSSAYGVYRLKPAYVEYSRFIHYLVRSTAFQWELQVRSKGIWLSRLQLTDEAFLGAPFPIPPSREQTAIVEYLDAQTAKIDAAIAADRKAIELLEEFRTRLIADVVTGKLDVRDAAANLPDEPPEEEEETIEDEGTNEEGEAIADADLEAISEEAEP